VTTSVAPPPNPLEETDKLLHKFEIDNIPAQYREYYGIKRNNFFASIQGFHEMWEYYLRLDAIWMREIEDLHNARDASRMFPLLLYLNAHAKMRVAMELAFSGCMEEARSILRDAVEFVAHAHCMINDPELQKVWLSKNDGKAALEEFKKAFEAHKRQGLFEGLDELYKTWGELSETGAHANINAMVNRFVQIDSDDHIEFRLNYTGLEPRIWALLLFTMLLTCATMEQTFFNDYEARLKLDNDLMRMRGEFDMYKEQLRQTLIARHNVEPPGGIHPAPKPTIYRP
jgi:tetratricopeptide (TPR) repeat protein